MAASNVTNSPVYTTRLIDDSSPLLLFDPPSAWNHTAEDGPDLYVNSTYSSSDVSGATCQFSFNGTGFSVLGARKPNYGEYLILLDGAVQQFSNATAQQTLFGQVLGTASGLEDGLHTVTFLVAGGGNVDIDAIVYEKLDRGQSDSHSGIQTASAPSPSSSQTTSSLPSASSQTVSSSSSSTSQTTSSPSSLSSQTSSVLSSSSSQTSSVPSSTSSQTASSPAPSSGNRISANPHAQGPNEPAPSQNASVSSASSSQSTAPSTSSIVSSTTASSSGQPSQSNAQPSDQDTATANQGAQPTAQPNGQSSAQPGPSGTTQSSTSSAPGPSISQAEQANSPQIAGTSAPQKGLPTGAIVGICIGVAAALLLIVAFLLCLMRRRRRAATARRRMTAGLPSPTLPLQDPSRHTSYFFGGQGNNANPGPAGGNGMRELYLAQGPQNSVTMQSRSTPFRQEPTTLQPAVTRDSVHSNSDTTALASEDGYITDASSRTVPTRPPRPPNVRLSIV